MKKIPHQAIIALKEALCLITWKKQDLKDFLKYSMENTAILGTINWECTKRESVYELIERMTNREDIYKTDIINLLLAVSDLTEFPQLDYWDDDGTKTAKAQNAVEKLRQCTKGYFQLTKEQEEIKLRKEKSEKKIAKNKSLAKDLEDLKELFYKLSANQNFQKRGFEFEIFLNKLFHLFELDPRASFKLHGEQIDGAFTFDSMDYLLEAKWKKQVNRSDLASFTHKVDSKLKITMGLVISVDGLTAEAVSPQFKSILIMDGMDLIAILEGRVSLSDLLYKKRRKANETGEIYIPFNKL